jgi:spermidine dehydrogenase
MTKADRELGMNRPITRRDFLNGVSVAVGTTLITTGELDAMTSAQQPAPDLPSDEYYPPARTGLRGSHPGSFEVAHSMRDGKTFETGEDTGESYDLVVVGGGLSGLAAAYYFRKKTSPGAKILILDNHDDFGGHAKRNEFRVGSRLLIAKGGTSYIERPATFTFEGKELLKDIGIDYYDSTAKIDREFYRSLGLRSSTYFDKETFGEDRLVLADPDPPRRTTTTTNGGGNGNGNGSGNGQTPSSVVGGGRREERPRAPSAEYLARTPLSEQVRKDVLRLWNDKPDYFSGLSKEEKVKKLQKTSYKSYLLDVVKVHPDVLKYYHPGGQPSVLTIETTSSWWAFNNDLPGFEGLGLEKGPESGEVLDNIRPDQKEPTQFHFPEGNAGVARLLVQSLIPSSLTAKSMADSELARVKYDKLDVATNPVRIRLNSTVVRARNVGDPSTSSEVEVVYVNNGKAYRVKGKGCVLACYHAVIPYMCPELPAAQKDALHMAVRGVNMSTNVAIRNWTAFQKLGVSSVSSPGTSYPGYSSASLGTPISMGKYKPPRTPDEPIFLTLGGGVDYKTGVNARDLFRAARQAMYQTTFETYERKIRTHLGRVLSGGGFDPGRDIAAITINRWPHGYAMGQNWLFDPDWSDDDAPWVHARKRFGRITIANSDAVGVCLTQAAFDQAYRAVDELMSRRVAWGNRV